MGQSAAGRTAEARNGDLIELRYRGNTAQLPVAVVPGHPDNAVTVFFGYGRRRTGRVGAPSSDVAKEFDVYRLRTSDAPWFGGGLEIAKSGGRYVLARTQEHHLMEGRNPVRVGLDRGIPRETGGHRAAWANGRRGR